MRRDDINITELNAVDRPNDRWMCGRGPHPCSQGPDKKGRCPLSESCRTRRTWSGWKRRVFWSSVAVLMLALLIASRRGIAPIVFKPGELSRPHAQILAGTIPSQRCSACHTQASTQPVRWFASAGKEHHGVSQSDRCLDCHHTIIRRDTAKLAHNLPAGVRRQLKSQMRLLAAESGSWQDRLPGPSISQDDIECSACHREHRGKDASLVSLSNRQCQTCHAVRFDSFATSHPDWDRWPYGRGGAIAFDHRTHLENHFPATSTPNGPTKFVCASCHQLNRDGELTRSVSYESSCQACHDRTLRLEAIHGLDLVALPTMSKQVIAGVADWPEPATGPSEGRIAPLLELLLRGDRQVAAAMRRVDGQELAMIDPSEPGNIDALADVARAHRDFLRDVGSKGHPEIVSRASAAGLRTQQIEQVLRALPPQLIRDAYHEWFQQDATNLTQRGDRMGTGFRLVDFHDSLSMPPSLRLAIRPNDQDLLSENNDLLIDGGSDDRRADPLTLESDPLLETPSVPLKAADATPRFDPSAMMPFGGWYRDDLRLAISYRGGGHGDPVIRSTIELIADLPAASELRRRFLATRAISACIVCHPGATRATVTWRSDSRIGQPGTFTKFAHKAHLNVSQLGDCVHCHQINREKAETPSVNLVSSNGHDSNDEFLPLNRATCASCHQPHAAGDACVQCHRYHIDGRRIPRIR